MASKFPYSKAWAVSVVGCPLSPPANWWPGNKGNTMPCPVNIAFVDPEAPAQSFFTFRLDNGGECYGMQYATKLAYADHNHRSFSNYLLRLPNVPPTEPKEPTATVQTRKKSVSGPT